MSNNCFENFLFVNAWIVWLCQDSYRHTSAAAFTTQNAFDQLRQKTEREVFEMFLDEFEVLWKNILIGSFWAHYCNT